ncbi:MAG: hypothetical protein ACRDTX_20730 [Pseudonocardiaceae bacterium]
MMGNDHPEAKRRWRRRAGTVIGLGVTPIVAFTAVALAHPVFSNNPPGFPNPLGSTGTPYTPGSTPTMNMFLPYEQGDTIFPDPGGAANTTIDVKVTIPPPGPPPSAGPRATRSGRVPRPATSR